jgi:predicted DCC family thiol-disulfide oxidoreductase YuxK
VPARGIILFDGVCNLCNGAVRFITENAPADRFEFVSLQSERGIALAGEERAPDDETIVLIEYGRRYERSDALLHIALGMRAPWPLAFALILLPRAVRDRGYRWIARNRYRWFGRNDVCALP